MYGPLISSIEKIACVCGMDRDQCDGDLLNAQTSLIDTKAYMDAKATAGKQVRRGEGSDAASREYNTPRISNNLSTNFYAARHQGGD